MRTINGNNVWHFNRQRGSNNRTYIEMPNGNLIIYKDIRALYIYQSPYTIIETYKEIDWTKQWLSVL